MTLALTLLLVLAAAADIRTHRIPNWLTLAGLAVGLVGNGWLGGGGGLRESLAGIGVASLALALYAVRALGAGDVKLLGAVGALMGPGFLLWTLPGTILAGGLLAWPGLGRPTRHIASGQNAAGSGHCARLGIRLCPFASEAWAMKRRRQQKGTSLVEFALVSSLLFLLLFGIIEMGLLFQDQAEVSQAAREAARSASVGDPTSTAKNRAVTVGIGLSLTATNVTLEQSANSGATWTALGDSGASNNAASGSLVRATITYNHPLVTSYVFSGGSRTLTAKMVMRRE